MSHPKLSIKCKHFPFYSSHLNSLTCSFFMRIISASQKYERFDTYTNRYRFCIGIQIFPWAAKLLNLRKTLLCFKRT